MDETSKTCEILRIKIELSPQNEVYEHGWGTNCNQAKRIRYNWNFTVFDVEGKQTTFPFDMINGSSP